MCVNMCVLRVNMCMLRVCMSGSGMGDGGGVGAL